MRFLNVDLEIESKGDLSLLVEEFGEDVSVLHHGQIRGLNHLLVESGSGSDGDADDIVARLSCLVINLPPEARAVWDACCTRVFDIGYDATGPGGGVQIGNSERDDPNDSGYRRQHCGHDLPTGS